MSTSIRFIVSCIKALLMIPFFNNNVFLCGLLKVSKIEIQREKKGRECDRERERERESAREREIERERESVREKDREKER